MDAVGDYRTFYVEVKNGNIISQYEENEYENVVETLRNKQLEYLKSKDYNLYGNLPSVKSSIEYLNKFGVFLPYHNSVCTNYLWGKPCICELTWEQIKQQNQLYSDILNTITSIYHCLLSVNIMNPKKTSYVFNFSKDAYCRVFQDFILIFQKCADLDVLIFNIAGHKLSQNTYHRKLYIGNIPFETKDLIIYDRNIKKYVTIGIDNGIFTSTVDYTYSRFKLDVSSRGHTAIHSFDSSSRVLSRYYNDKDKPLTFTFDELNTFKELRDFYKDGKYIFSITSGFYGKFFKNFFLIVKNLTDDEYNDNWKLWIYNYDGKLFNEDYLIINGQYFARVIINYTLNNIIAFSNIENATKNISFRNDQISYTNVGNRPKKAAIIKSSNEYIKIYIKERIKNYLYSLNIDLPDYNGGYDNYNSIIYLKEIQSISINNQIFKINPHIKNACLDEIYYRHKNRPNFISKIEFVNKYQTTDGVVELYRFHCTPHALMDTAGNIFYDFNIDEVTL